MNSVFHCIMAHRVLRSSKHLLNRTITKSFEKLLILDFEATCLKNEMLTPQEIIEFPCVVLSTIDWQVKDVFHEYIKPRVHPQLSSFCTELTGIMQESVENENYFPEVFSKFCNWLEEGNYFKDDNTSVFVTCGNWDLKVMLPNQCKLNNIELSKCFKEWIDLKMLFYHITKYYPRSLPDMLKYLNRKFQGKHHCGIDDVHNMIRIIQILATDYNMISELKEIQKTDFIIKNI